MLVAYFDSFLLLVIHDAQCPGKCTMHVSPGAAQPCQGSANPAVREHETFSLVGTNLPDYPESF